MPRVAQNVGDARAGVQIGRPVGHDQFFGGDKPRDETPRERVIADLLEDRPGHRQAKEHPVVVRIAARHPVAIKPVEVGRHSARLLFPLGIGCSSLGDRLGWTARRPEFGNGAGLELNDRFH